ncbi:MAG TPA: CPBP family intramembrane glutamic endopeptidase [Propionibacteriaceae bacterium]|nr:CPBP family intramembrane glutamic endopeptidase [Propionibacteriaceae bacterium]
MGGQIERAARTDDSPLRSWIVRHPIATFLVLVYATTTALVFVPKGLTEPGLLPGGATPHGALENVLGSAVPAFIVAALVSGKAGVRDLARRSFRWRVPLRWYLISLLAPLLIFLIAVTILYGLAPLRALAGNWLLLFTGFLPALAIMILLNNVAEEIGWTGFVFARFQDRHGPLRAALLTTVFFWLFHVSSFYVDTRSWATTALVLGIFLLPQLGSRLIAGWLYNSAGSSVLIAGLFHAMHNAVVNSTGLVAVVDLPQFEVLVIMDGIVVLAGAIIAVATRGRLGLNRPESNANLNSEG